MRNMVCAAEVFQWFQRLDASSRVDFFVGLMEMLHPFELRFVGTIIEDLARKNSSVLRDVERQFKNVENIKQLRDVCDPIARGHLAIIVAVMTSASVALAAEIYSIVYAVVREPEKYSKELLVAPDWLLLLTLIVHHPAFSFHQRSQLKEFLNVLTGGRDNEPITGSEGGRGIVASELQRKATEHQAFAGFEGLSVDIDSESITEDSIDIDRRTTETRNISMIDASQVASSSQEATIDNPFVVNIDVRGSQGADSVQDPTFPLQLRITWSDGTTSDIWRNKNDFTELHKQMVQLFPGDSNASKDNRQMPYSPGLKCKADEVLPRIRSYCQRLLALPPQYREFLRAHFLNPDLSGVARAGSVDMDAGDAESEASSTLGSSMSSDKQCNGGVATPASILSDECNRRDSPSSPRRQRTGGVARSGRSKDYSRTERGYYDSYARHAHKHMDRVIRNTNYARQNADRNHVRKLNDMLTAIGLVEYRPKLIDYPIDKLFAAKHADIESCGIPKEAVQKILDGLAKLQLENARPINGMTKSDPYCASSSSRASRRSQEQSWSSPSKMDARVKDGSRGATTSSTACVSVASFSKEGDEKSAQMSSLITQSPVSLTYSTSLQQQTTAERPRTANSDGFPSTKFVSPLVQSSTSVTSVVSSQAAFAAPVKTSSSHSDLQFAQIKQQAQYSVLQQHNALDLVSVSPISNTVLTTSSELAASTIGADSVSRSYSVPPSKSQSPELADQASLTNQLLASHGAMSTSTFIYSAPQQSLAPGPMFSGRPSFAAHQLQLPHPQLGAQIYLPQRSQLLMRRANYVTGAGVLTATSQNGPPSLLATSLNQYQTPPPAITCQCGSCPLYPGVTPSCGGYVYAPAASAFVPHTTTAVPPPGYSPLYSSHQLQSAAVGAVLATPSSDLFTVYPAGFVNSVAHQQSADSVHLAQQPEELTLSAVNNVEHVEQSRQISCCNCGHRGHTLVQCHKSTLEEISQPGLYSLNYESGN